MLHRYIRACLCALFLSSFLSATTGTYTWQFAIATNRWTNTTTSDVWTLSRYTFTKSGGSSTPSGGFSEVWTYNPLNTRWSETSVGSNLWEHTGPGTWTEHNAMQTWKWSAPTTGNPRGIWNLNGTGTAWTYDETAQIWTETGTSNTKFFPPYLPPQVVVQHQEILSAYDHLTTREIPDSTTNISWTDGYETITYDYTAGTWTFELPSYAPTYDDTPEWKDNVAISGGPAYTERWTAAENADKKLGRTFTHASASLTGGETIHYNAAANTWSYNNSTTHAWYFDPENNEWCNNGTNARYEYDTRNRMWIQTDKGTPLRTWRPQKDTTEGWIWHDVSGDVKWQYSSGTWENLDTTATFFATGAKLEDDSGDLWSYSPAAWTKDGSSDTGHLFPLLPPNPAGQLGRIQQQGYLLAQEHLAAETAFKASYDSQKASFDSAVASRGSTRVTAVTALATPALTLANNIAPWQTTYRQLSSPHYSTGHIFAPTADGSFKVWNRLGWRFPETGKTVCYFEAKGASKLTLGFAVTPPTDGTALYWIIGQDSATTTTIHNASGQIASTTTTTFIPDGTTWYKYWLSYNNGIITLGTGEKVGFNTVYTYDLSGSPQTGDIKFLSFAAQSGATFEFRNIHCTPYNQATSRDGSLEINARVPDEIKIGNWQTPYDANKTGLNDIESDITTSERKATLAPIKTALTTSLAEMNAAKSATDSAGYGSTGALAHAGSRTAFDAVLNETKLAYEISSEFADVVTHVTAIENEVINLFLELQNNLSLSAFTAKRDTAAANATTSIDALITLLTSLVSKATTLQATPGNSALTLLRDTLKEELAIAQVQKLAIPYFKERMLLKYHQATPSSDELTRLTNINLATTLAATEKTSLANTLAAQLAAGSLTMYATVVGMVAMSVKQKMAQVRTQASTQLAADSELHDFPSTGHTYATASTNEQTICDNQAAVQSELETTITPLVLTSDPGTDKPPKPTITDLITAGSVDETVTAAGSTDLTNQELETDAGTSETPNITLISEGAVIQELKVDATDKTDTHLQIRTKEATISLGRTDLTKDSGKAVTVLGSSSLIPDSEGVVYLSSDVRVLVNDISTSNLATPLQAGPDFGKSTTDTRCIGTLRLAEKGSHRLEFRTTGRQQSIIIGRGVELNLTNFGRGDTARGQNIVFGDNVSLVLQPGASIRLPYLEPSRAQFAPVLDFAGQNARLIFEDPQNRDATYWTDTKTGSDTIRNKLLGNGVFRFSGPNSRMEILRGALVSCEADYTSPRTDIRVEIVGQGARCEIGNESIAGGALQIGNFQDGGYNRRDVDNYPNNNTHPLFGDATTPFEPRTQQIDFDLLVNGPGAELHIGREGFLGFGVGVVNKTGNPNGDTPDAATDPATDPAGFSYDAWRVQSLYNVGSIKLSILDGSLHHNSIGMGNDKNASLLAIGPVDSLGAYQFQFNKTGVSFPGGNIMFMHKNADSAVAEGTPMPLRLWDTITPTLTGTSADNGKYSLLAPLPIIVNRKEPSLINTGSYTFEGGSVTDAGNIFTFVGNSAELYRLLAMRSYIADSYYVPLKKEGTALTIPYITTSNIIRHLSIQPRDVLTPAGDPIPLSRIGINGYLEGRDGNTPPQFFTQK